MGEVNQISDEKFEAAHSLVSDGRSIREVARIVGIAKQTAHTIYAVYRQIQEDHGEPVLKKRKGGYWDHKKHLSQP